MDIFRTVLWLLIAAFAGLLAWTGFNWQAGPDGQQKPFGVPFALVDQNGHAVTEAAFRGKPTAIFFGYTNCPDVCPTTLYELDGWLREADPDGRRIRAYFVTVDPERDTPEILNRYVSNVSGRIIGLGGEPARVHAMVKGFGIYSRKVPLDAGKPEDYSMDHTASIFLLNSAGRLRSTISFGERHDIALRKIRNLLDRPPGT